MLFGGKVIMKLHREEMLRLPIKDIYHTTSYTKGDVFCWFGELQRNLKPFI